MLPCPDRCALGRLVPALLALGLVACATPPGSPGVVNPAAPPYAAPSQGQAQARLLLRPVLAPGERLLLLSLGDHERCTQPQVLARLNAGQTPSALALHADRLHTLDVVLLRAPGTPATGTPAGTGTTPGSTAATPACGTRWSFKPLSGKTYLLQVASAGNLCPSRVVDATAADRPQNPPDLVSRVGSSNRCLPLAESVRPVNPLEGGQQHGDAVLNPHATARDLEGLIQP